MVDEFRNLLRGLKASKDSIVTARKWLSHHPKVVAEALEALLEVRLLALHRLPCTTPSH